MGGATLVGREVDDVKFVLGSDDRLLLYRQGLDRRTAVKLFLLAERIPQLIDRACGDREKGITLSLMTGTAASQLSTPIQAAGRPPISRQSRQRPQTQAPNTRQ